MIQFGIAAAVDAVLAVFVEVLLRIRGSEKNIEEGIEVIIAQRRKLFSRYLYLIFFFLALASGSIFIDRPTFRALFEIIADIFLWLSLLVLIEFTFLGRQGVLKQWVIGLFIVFAASGSLFQIQRLIGINIPLSREFAFVLSHMAFILMQSVWIPSAVFFISRSGHAPRSIRIAHILFGIGLLCISASWFYRVLFIEPQIVITILISLAGFALLLGGMTVHGRASSGGKKTILRGSTS